MAGNTNAILYRVIRKDVTRDGVVIRGDGLLFVQRTIMFDSLERSPRSPCQVEWFRGRKHAVITQRPFKFSNELVVKMNWVIFNECIRGIGEGPEALVVITPYVS